MTEPKRIHHVFSTLEVGGSQRRFAEYYKNSKANFAHTVYAMDGNYDALSLMPGLNPPDHDAPLVEKGNTLKAIRQCRSSLKNQKPDLLVTYNWGATEWVLANAFLSVCPTVHIQDGFGPDEQSREKLIRRCMRAFAYRQCAKVIVPSVTLKNLAKNDWLIPKSILQYIPNGINVDAFIRPPDNELATSYGIDTNKKIIGIVSALRPEKNIGKLIEAFSMLENMLDDIQLVIVGDGVGMAALKMLAERVCKPGNVIFTGNLSNPEKILPLFNIFALSSDTEQMPLCVIEAMASGLPIVSTDVGDVSHMVSAQNTPYISRNDPATLAENLHTLLLQSEMANRIGAANQAKAKKSYDLKTMIESYDTLFSELTHPG